MCVITRKEDNVVVSISLIPGLDDRIYEQYNVYFPVVGELPYKGDVWVGKPEWLCTNAQI